MSETSPTDTVDNGNGSASADLPAPTSTNQSADGQQPESVSSDPQKTDQSTTTQPDDQTTGTDSSSSSDDDGLSKFAKAQGFDPDNLTDGERKALKLAHDNQKAYRQTSQEKSDQLKETLEDTHKVTENELTDLDKSEVREAKRDSEIAQIRASQKVNDFYVRSPEAKDYDKEMTAILIEEAKTNGPEAARYLGADLNRLLVLAKAKRGEPSAETIANKEREDRELQRKRQDGSADSGQATQSHTSPKKITRADIASMPDEEYIKLRDSGELDAAIQRGDLY